VPVSGHENLLSRGGNRAIYVRVKKDPNKLAFMDLAMTPVTDDEDLEMFHTPSAPAFLEQEQRRLHAHEHAAVA